MFPKMPETTLKEFQHVCQAKNLDPIQKEIYAIERKGKWSFEASIHGLLKVCAGHLDGVQTLWYDEKGQAFDIWLPDHAPNACKAIIYRRGATRPFEASVRYKDFAATQNGPWRTMPSVMIRKVAVSHALRFGFADLIGGLYEEAEMAQIENTPNKPSTNPIVPNPESTHFKNNPEQLAQHQGGTQAPPPPQPRKIAPPQPAPQVDPAVLAAATAPINEGVKSALMPKMGQLNDEQRSKVVFQFKEKAGIDPNTAIGPDTVKTEQHAQILIELLTPLVDLSDVPQVAANA